MRKLRNRLPSQSFMAAYVAAWRIEFSALHDFSFTASSSAVSLLLCTHLANKYSLDANEERDYAHRPLLSTYYTLAQVIELFTEVPAKIASYGFAVSALVAAALPLAIVNLFAAIYIKSAAKLSTEEKSGHTEISTLSAEVEPFLEKYNTLTFSDNEFRGPLKTWLCEDVPLAIERALSTPSYHT